MFTNKYFAYTRRENICMNVLSTVLVFQKQNCQGLGDVIKKLFTVDEYFFTSSTKLCTSVSQDLFEPICPNAPQFPMDRNPSYFSGNKGNIYTVLRYV